MLSNQELKERVGCAQNARLKRWLEEHRVPWVNDANGNPVTTETLLTEAIRVTRPVEVTF